MLDDLRRDNKGDSFDLDDEDDFDIDDDSGSSSRTVGGGDSLIFGLNAVERMMLSIMLFLLVVVVGFALLLATNRIQL